MSRFDRVSLVVGCLAAAIAFSTTLQIASAGEVLRLNEGNWNEATPQGKEVDCIYGDWVIRNKQIVAVIASAVPGRNANMTVRNVGGSVIDLTRRSEQSDQLSAYYPLNAQYDLSGPLGAGDAVDEKAAETTGQTVVLRFRGPAADKRSTAEVIYSLADDANWLKVVTRVTNNGKEPLPLDVTDSIRADGEFDFGQSKDLGLFWAYDSFWRQAYGVLLTDRKSRIVADTLKRGDHPQLKIEQQGAAPTLAPGETRETVRYLFPAANTLDLLAVARDLREEPSVDFEFSVRDPNGAVDGATIDVKSLADEPVAHGLTDVRGRLLARLSAGKYQITTSAPGRGEKSTDIDATQGGRHEFELSAPGYVVAKITDDQARAIPCKVQFSGKAGTPTPNFGPDSAIHGVRNLYYTENGVFRTAITPGEYDVIVSYGPEFDAVFTTLSVAAGKDTALQAVLKHTVDTTGWISSDFHSHSTPSGDNTASQAGRVLNLLAEHIEFAPCTEHNRITVYDPHLKQFDAVARMLTCPGMELTGRPLPINHQNAFPLKPRPRTQDGGAPVSDVNPVVQIERLAMWNDASDKLVQINHPNIPQMIGDRDLDGSPDGGFEKMFSFVDVIEVHPLGGIFSKPAALPTGREQSNTVFHWLQLQNLGYRVPGVVNTDAHWNFHGSGWLRNYIKSATDDPAKASVADLVHTCEHGNIVVTNGPFLEVRAKADTGDDVAAVGENLSAPGGKLRLDVRVQCANWLEVNRVQVFVNGKPEPKWNYTRRTHPNMFHERTIVFAETLPVELTTDAHLVVVAAGEGKELGPVVGPDHAKEMPTAVGNPIFVDVDGSGFKPNGDMLGLPLPIGSDFKPSKPHEHKHKH